jgi:hypothetical protein
MGMFLPSPNFLHEHLNVIRHMPKSQSGPLSPSRPKHNPSQLSLPTTISSYSSADCDSGSDFTDEDDDTKSKTCYNVSSDVHKLIKYLLCKVQWHLYFSSVTLYAGSSRSSSTCREAESLEPNHKEPHRSSREKRRASDRDDEQRNREEDGNPKKRRKVTPSSDTEMMLARPFACPFFKHDPQLYSARRSCPGPGWPTVHRLK